MHRIQNKQESTPPTNMRIVEPFIDYLDDVTREALRSDKQIIIVGDLNCDCLDESAAQTIALTTHFTDMCIPHFFLASERRSTVNVRRRPGYKIWRLFKFEFSEVNINQYK
jgi:exonuclease III